MKKQDSEFRTVRGYQMIDRRNGRLTPAMEDYLEMIFRLCRQDGYARVGRISELLNVKPPSVSKMILKLSGLGLLKYDRYEIIQLTPAGEKKGGYLLKRHNTVRQFLDLLGSSQSLEETELIEHSLSQATVSHLITMLAFFSREKETLEKLKKFQQKNGRHPVPPSESP